MNAFVRGIYLLAILSSSILGYAQSGSPQAALEEVATAENLETVLRHLPPSVERNIRRLSPEQRVGMENQLLIGKKMKAEGVELQRGSDGSTWELTGPSNADDMSGASARRKKILITIQNAIENGNDAVLILDGRPAASEIPDQAQPDFHKRESALIWMKFEDGEWRITDVGAVERVNIEDLLLRGGVESDSSQAAREASAVGALRTLNTAIVAYESAYENVGQPPSIAALACPSDETCKDPSAEHAALVDSTFAASPLIRSGYEFQYMRISSDRYTITARSLGVDMTATPRSFFTDESGVIRFTQENRAATAQDPPLQ
jgi:type IV pilus assembly protein PilA